jgi:protein subunit release factor B
MAAPQHPSEAERRAAARAAALSDEALAAECEIEPFNPGGPGGQHRNKTETGIRIRHLPTGVAVTATERRSQHQNRQAALDRLRARLLRRASRPKPRKKTVPSGAARRRRLEEKRRHAQTKQRRRTLE